MKTKEKQALKQDEWISLNVKVWLWFLKYKKWVIPFLVLLILCGSAWMIDHQIQSQKNIEAIQALFQSKTQEELESFLAKYSDTPASALGIKRLTELYIAEKNWTNAIVLADQFLVKFPEHTFTICMALEKAYILESQATFDQLDVFYSTMIEKYKDSLSEGVFLMRFAESLIRRDRNPEARPLLERLSNLKDSVWQEQAKILKKSII